MNQVAIFLGSHAVALLALGMLAILLAFGAVVALVRLARRHADSLRPIWTRVRPWIPAEHIAIHLGLGFIAVTALVTVAIIARQVTSGSAIAQFDLAFARALDQNTTPGWHRFFQVVTLMGTGSALGITSAVVGLYLLLRRRFTLAIGWGLAQAGAVILVKVIKAIVERARPGLGDPTFFASGYSFPSGHVVRTLALCGVGAYLVFRLTRSWLATTVACAIAALCSLVMAFSRLYLGAHFASDVVAGLIVGTAWVAICASAMEAALRRSEPRGTEASSM